ncbi:MAG: thermonuclease family protein, partial [Chloroflexia bacterium]
MQRSRLLLALGVAGLGLAMLATLFAKAPTDNGVRPTSTPTVIALAATATTLPRVTPTEPGQPATTLLLAPSSTPFTASRVPPEHPPDSAGIAPSSPTPVTEQPTATPITVALTEAILTRVIDGDTLEVSFAGRTERVRLIGVDSPEINGPPICYGQEATAHAQELLPQAGGTIWLEKDISETDRYGRLLRYVWLDPMRQRMLDEVMVADGYAQVSTYPPDVKYQDRFLAAERSAMSEQRGLWGTCEYFGAPLLAATYTPYPTTPPAPIAASTSTLEPLPSTLVATPAPPADLPYDPNGPDRDCPDFATHDEA